MKSSVATCRLCGCTEADCRPCIARTGKPCSWADSRRDLCTACVTHGSPAARPQPRPAFTITK